ncbi:hypothetical protein TWF788_002461 [Orbilia oligospora]|uniref:chitin synthase n=1 Tax=Orbilia oligospora TaxID=2813651 RepID=A0A7C8PBQ7_ORBOL|nr:hypothetical protein TWF788_002461 [Orbilia oligospora]
MATQGDEGFPPDFLIPDTPTNPTIPTETPGIHFTAGDIAFLAVGSPVYFAILLEWLAWLGAFLYCFYHCLVKAVRSKDYKKAILTIFMITLFVILRLCFIPVLVVSIPLPTSLRARLPGYWASLLELVAFYAFVVLLLLPTGFIIYNIFNKRVGRKARYASLLNDDSPKVIIIMPCYNESAENVMKCINSIVEQDYPMICLHICLSFDSDEITPDYLEVLTKLGVPMVHKNKFPVAIDVRYQGTRITVSRYKHGGKRHTQKKTFQMIDRLYEKYLERQDDVYLLFIDSDCILDKYCIQNFMYEMDFLPKRKKGRQVMAMTGVITSRVEKGQGNFITLLQDMEYMHGQLFERAVESSCGAVTCLPGALTCLKFSAFRNMSVFYFADMADKHDNPFDYGQYHLGEDRWLTHLFMIGAKRSYQIGFNTSAFCKTEACSTWNSLINQRTRWFKGFITNEAAMLTDWQLWQRYPFLCVFRMMQDTIRTTALLLVLLVLSLMTKVQTVPGLPLPLIALSLGLNWVFMTYYGFQLKRKKAFLYPVLFMANPVLNWWYLIASVYSYRRRSWGGPRVQRKVGQIPDTSEEEDESDGLPELSDRERDAIREAALPWRTLSGRFVPAHVGGDGLYHRSDLQLPLSGRSSVILPQLLNSDAASTLTRNSEAYLTDHLAPPMPNRNSVFSTFSYDSEVGRLYAPAQTFLHTNGDNLPDLESRYTTPAPLDDYCISIPVPFNVLKPNAATQQMPPRQIPTFQVPNHTGDLGAMSFAQIHEAQFGTTLPHAISDNTPPHYRAHRLSVQNTIDILYPPSIVAPQHQAEPDTDNRPSSPDSWTRDDDAAFSAGPMNKVPKDPFETPKSQPQSGVGSAKSKGKLVKKKPASMEIDDGSVKEKKGGILGFLKKH